MLKKLVVSLLLLLLSKNQRIIAITKTSKMNSTGKNKYSKEFKIPEGFDEVLRNLTREILRSQPEDINKFGTLLLFDFVIILIVYVFSI
jgi:Flp pilus assembly CpaF family ATPase